MIRPIPPSRPLSASPPPTPLPTRWGHNGCLFQCTNFAGHSFHHQRTVWSSRPTPSTEPPFLMSSLGFSKTKGIYRRL